MTTITDKLLKIKEALTPVTENVYHYWRTNKRPPYLIWMEDGEENSLPLDNRKAEQQLHGTVDYFTKVEFDSTIDAIQDALNSMTGYSHKGWQLSAVQYEEDTGLIHYTWDWWVV